MITPHHQEGTVYLLSTHHDVGLISEVAGQYIGLLTKAPRAPSSSTYDGTLRTHTTLPRAIDALQAWNGRPVHDVIEAPLPLRELIFEAGSR